MVRKCYCLMHQPDAVTHTYTERKALWPLEGRQRQEIQTCEWRRGKLAQKEAGSKGKRKMQLALPLCLGVSGLRLGLRQTSWEAGSSTAW